MNDALIDHTDGSLAAAWTASLPDGPGGRWLALPPGRAPRVLMSRAHLAADPFALRDVVGHTGALRRGSVALASAAIAKGGGRLVPEHETWSLVGSRLLAHARALAGTPDAHAIIRLSPARPNSKPVVQLVASDFQRTLAWVKIGWDDHTRPLVAREAAVLAELDPPASLRVPDVLGVSDGPVGGLALSALVTNPRMRRASTPITLAQAAHRVFGVDGFGVDGECAFGDTPLVRDRAERLDELDETPLVSHLRRVLHRIRDAFGDIEVRTGRWHGDWNRANAALDGDVVAAWDWERSATGAPLDLDAAFTLMFTQKPLEARRQLQLALPHTQPRLVQGLVALAALCSAVRYAESEQVGVRTDASDALDRLDGALA